MFYCYLSNSFLFVLRSLMDINQGHFDLLFNAKKGLSEG